LGDEAELNRIKAWRREKGEEAERSISPSRAVLVGERERERERLGERKNQRMRSSHAREGGTCTLYPAAPPTPRLGSVASLGCPRADGSAPPGSASFGSASRTRHAPRQVHAASGEPPLS
jgi:hypothetical protein